MEDKENKSLRKRTKNLSSNEKECIISIVCKYKNIVENKCSDSKSLQEKAKIWDKITAEFNSNSEVKRNKDQLKIYYKNAKSKLKKGLAYKSDSFKTEDVIDKKFFDENDPLRMCSIVIEETGPVSNSLDSTATYFRGDTENDNTTANVINRTRYIG